MGALANNAQTDAGTTFTHDGKNPLTKPQHGVYIWPEIHLAGKNQVERLHWAAVVAVLRQVNAVGYNVDEQLWGNHVNGIPIGLGSSNNPVRTAAGVGFIALQSFPLNERVRRRRPSSRYLQISQTGSLLQQPLRVVIIIHDKRSGLGRFNGGQVGCHLNPFDLNHVEGGLSQPVRQPVTEPR